MDEKESVPQEQPAQPDQKEPQEIVIRLKENGQIDLNWTIPSLIACLGLLEMAKQQIMAHSAQQAMKKAMREQKIIKPKDNIFKNGLARIIGK